MFDASEYWITVVELPEYENDIAALLTPEEQEGIIAFLARHPDEGTMLPYTGGVRKISWGARGRHQAGGAQIFYFFRDLNMPLYVLSAVPRGERVRLTKVQEAMMRAITTEIVSSQWDKQVEPLVQIALRPKS